MTQSILSQPAQPIPFSARLPVIGALPQLIHKQFDYLHEAHQQHGDIFRIDLGLTEAIALNHPRHAQYVLRDNARNFRKGGNMWTSVRTMFGNGLVVSEGDFWLRQRRMMQPHFHHRYLAGLFDLMLTAIDDQIATWPQTATDFDFTTAVNQITMQVIVRTMFGTQLTNEEFDQLSDAITYALDYLLVGMISTTLPNWVPTPGKRRYQEALQTFDAIVYRVIAECRKGEGEANLLSMLLNTVDAETGEQMTDQQLRDEVATIFVAGYETTAIGLAWAAEYLARDQALQTRLATTIDTAIGTDIPELSTLRDLGLVKQTFQEALRIRPSVWFIPRETLEDDEIDGHLIPAGSQIALLVSHIHHHTDQWENPEQFNPDRFAQDKTKSRHPFSYIPFGAGQRQCIGRDFAYMEGQLILTRILQQYQLSPNGNPATPQLTTTLRPKGGLSVRLKPRNM